MHSTSARLKNLFQQCKRKFKLAGTIVKLAYEMCNMLTFHCNNSFSAIFSGHPTNPDGFTRFIDKELDFRNTEMHV